MNKEVLNKAITHLYNDTDIHSLILKYERPKFKVPDRPFIALSKSIIYQQLSASSARAIHTRFLNLFDNKPTPIDVNTIKIEALKKNGLSYQKINYLKELSRYFLDKKEQLNFSLLTNDEVYAELIPVKGIGQWTIDMFLIFTLHRTDILPINDLGIKKGLKILYNLDDLPSEKFMLKKSKEWDPYQSIASLYLWKILDDGDEW